MKLTLIDGGEILEFDLMGDTVIKIDNETIWTSDSLMESELDLDDFLKDLYTNKHTPFEF